MAAATAPLCKVAQLAVANCKVLDQSAQAGVPVPQITLHYFSKLLMRLIVTDCCDKAHGTVRLVTALNYFDL
jgi:hypothetical protein